ncbi:hypothetical protein WR25_03078 [Diploscapter pachys]|uniref:ETS domain-containing protein n=1 Tax=Diploscapter pachys TaxID=2018661 RepID=A0A2A2L6A5_9BILA|nr:hypothetical protein WR25_03078 [Diploscapter pachys]
MVQDAVSPISSNLPKRRASEPNYRRKREEPLWEFLFRLCTDPTASHLIEFSGDGLKFIIVDLPLLAQYYYYPNDKYLLNNEVEFPEFLMITHFDRSSTLCLLMQSSRTVTFGN